MVTYFGEVVHPSSRAFWNDDDEDEIFCNNELNLDFEIKWIGQEPPEFEKFIIIEGEIVIDFVRSCLLKDAVNVGMIINESKKSYSKIYSISDGIYICAISSKVELAQAGQLTEAIVPLISKTKNLFALTCDHISHFKNEKDITTESILKCLHSSKAKSNSDYKTSILNQPNIITGVCAGVLSYAEILHLPCIIYMLYIDTFTLDSKNASPLIELFSKLLGKTLPNFTVESSSFLNKGNLYM